MTFSVGDIVITKLEGTHKRVAFVDRSFLRLEYYDETGIQVESINPARCIFVDSKPTDEWNAMLEAERKRVLACRKYHEDHPVKPKKM